jgi:hypothetical protein
MVRCRFLAVSIAAAVVTPLVAHGRRTLEIGVLISSRTRCCSAPTT